MFATVGQVVVALVEVGGIQRYIFDTPKRREQVGASQLIHECTATWAPQVMQEVGGCIPVIASAGRVVATVDSEAHARRLVAGVTRRALVEAPGLEVFGAVAQIDLDNPNAWGLLQRRLARARSERPSAMQRHLRLPCAAECDSSGLGASAIVAAGGGAGTVRLSASSHAKVVAAPRSLQRLARESGKPVADIRRYIDDDSDGWVAVVHADVNDLGRWFVKLAGLPADELDRIDGIPDDGVHRRLAAQGALSSAIERAMRYAYRAALHGRNNLPLVLGGDDLTVIVPGAGAVDTTVTLLDAFGRFVVAHHNDPEDRAAASTLRAVGERCGHPGGQLGLAAGVAIVKAHYPFSLAHTLAVQLCRSAKTVKQHLGPSAGAFDFHVQFDSVGTGLDEIRAALSTPARLYGGPYVVCVDATVAAGLSTNAKRWAEQHAWSRLDSAVQLVRSGKVSRSQWAALRSDLFAGGAVAEQRFETIRARHGDVIDALGAPGLFVTEAGQNATIALDALQIAALRDPS